jgi:superfamily II DNA/RNA helicase
MADNNKQLEMIQTMQTTQSTQSTQPNQTIKTEQIEYKSFENMEFLSFELIKGIYEYGFKIPSKIQNMVIKQIFDGGDIIAQSQSGTGKTGAFTIGALSTINVSVNHPQVMVLATTRELATQIHSVFTNISKHMGARIELCVGGSTIRGVNRNDPYKHIRSSHVLIGTPGRITDYINRKAFDPKKIKLFIMDEADALLKDDFIEQVKTTILEFDASTQICIFSATYTKSILDIANAIMTNPTQILLKREEVTLDLIKQFNIYVKFEEYKYSTLVDLYKNLMIGQCIIFVNSGKNAMELQEKLIADGFMVGAIYGGLQGTSRNDILRDFRTGLIRVLIATDIIGRGIDIEQIGIVINYDIPKDKSDYIHRIGRSGRFGKIGVAVNFITDRDTRTLFEIERHYNIKITDMPEFDVVLSHLNGIKGF